MFLFEWLENSTFLLAVTIDLSAQSFTSWHQLNLAVLEKEWNTIASLRGLWKQIKRWAQSNGIRISQKRKLITMALHLSLIICTEISYQYKCNLKTDQSGLHDFFNSVLFSKEQTSAIKMIFQGLIQKRPSNSLIDFRSTDWKVRLDLIWQI